MTKRIYESQGTVTVNPDSKTLRVCLITEGEGSSARFKREFFVQKNAEALAGSLSFPAHPMDIEHPEHRDPLSAIGSIGDTVDIEEHDGKMGFWSDYIPSKSKPQIAEYLAEYGSKLGLSIYMDSDGHNDSDGKWVAESLDPTDAYKSVDLVVAAGRGGKFEKVAESLGLLSKASATAGENEGDTMELKELADKVDRLTTVVETLATTLGDGKIAEAQGKADDAAVEKAVESRLKDYDEKVKLIAEAKLTESQSSDLLAKALKGEDIAPGIENAKKTLAEAKVLLGVSESDDDATKNGGKIAEAHLGGGKNDSGFDLDAIVPSGFGVV